MIDVGLHLPHGVSAAVIGNRFAVAVGVVVAVDQGVDVGLRMNLYTVLGGGDDQIHDVISRAHAASVGEAPGKLRAGGGQHILIERARGLGVQLGILLAVCGGAVQQIGVAGVTVAQLHVLAEHMVRARRGGSPEELVRAVGKGIVRRP